MPAKSKPRVGYEMERKLWGGFYIKLGFKKKRIFRYGSAYVITKEKFCLIKGA